MLKLVLLVIITSAGAMMAAFHVPMGLHAIIWTARRALSAAWHVGGLSCGHRPVMPPRGNGAWQNWLAPIYCVPGCLRS